MKGTLIMGIILLAGFAIGLPVGTILTQTQFDNINFQTANMELSLDNKNVTTDDIVLTISYDYLERTGDSWTVTRPETTIKYSLEDYYNCRISGNTKPECIQNAKDIILQQVRQFKQEKRDYLTSQQTKQAYKNEITSTDITIDNSELN